MLMMAFGVQPVPGAIPIEVQAQLSGATIFAIGGAAVAIITALAAGAVTIIKALRETQKQVAVGAKVQDQKLDNITVLVDGGYGKVLNELADVKELLARITGLQHDKLQAEAARADSDAQESRIRKLKDS